MPLPRANRSRDGQRQVGADDDRGPWMRGCDCGPCADDRRPDIKGCRVTRYGPDCVTSRPFSRWPAAQMRISSPAIAMGHRWRAIAASAWQARALRRRRGIRAERAIAPAPRRAACRAQTCVTAPSPAGDRRAPSPRAAKYRAGTSRGCGTAAGNDTRTPDSATR